MFGFFIPKRPKTNIIPNTQNLFEKNTGFVIRVLTLIRYFREVWGEISVKKFLFPERINP